MRTSWFEWERGLCGWSLLIGFLINESINFWVSDQATTKKKKKTSTHISTYTNTYLYFIYVPLWIYYVFETSLLYVSFCSVRCFFFFFFSSPYIYKTWQYYFILRFFFFCFINSEYWRQVARSHLLYETRVFWAPGNHIIYFYIYIRAFLLNFVGGPRENNDFLKGGN